MLTRIYIDNFRCFVNFEYRPESKQLLLGANGSGKSSLLNAILDLRTFVKGDENPFTQSSRTRWQEVPLQVFEVDALLGGEKYEYRVEIRFHSEKSLAYALGPLSVNLERLKFSGATVFELANGKIRFFPDSGAESPSALALTSAKSALHLAQFSNSHVSRFVEWMNSIQCFRIDAHPFAIDPRASTEESEPDDTLRNLAGWYRYLLQAHPEDNVRFLAAVKETLNGFKGLRFSSDRNGVRRLLADFTAPDTKKASYGLLELSEGQRCLLGLYMILHFLIAKGHTVFIDEPDNFIALREIQPWLLAAQEAVENHAGQLILVSHHPEILNQWASAYGLLFFREENGHVRTESFKGDPHGDLLPSELIARGWESLASE